jgi:hypothetical protein
MEYSPTYNKKILVKEYTTRPKTSSLYGDHTRFNEAMEILIRMLDRLDRFDRVFAQE